MSERTFSDKVFLTLKHKVARLDRLKAVNNLINNTDFDFTRKRKLPFPDVIMIILSMAGCPIREELLDYFDYDIDTATASAFVQARAKILPENYCICLTKHIHVQKHLKAIGLSQLTVLICVFLMTVLIWIHTNQKVPISRV